MFDKLKRSKAVTKSAASQDTSQAAAQCQMADLSRRLFLESEASSSAEGRHSQPPPGAAPGNFRGIESALLNPPRSLPRYMTREAVARMFSPRIASAYPPASKTETGSSDEGLE